MNKTISSLVNYYLKKGYIKNDDIYYCANQICSLIGEIEFEYFDKEHSENIETILKNLIKIAKENKKIENSSTEEERLITRLTDIFIPLPSILNDEIEKLPKQERLEKLYRLGVDTSYIKEKSLNQNEIFSYQMSKGELIITINLAKPEKDPLEIKKSIDQVVNYPKCLLCKENVGYKGSSFKPPRINHRIMPIKLENKEWFVQFSPYAYFDRHLIVISNIHQNMCLTDDTIKYQLNFVEQFPNYFIGTNADLPIVGGSILTHEHYQAGIFKFPIEESSVIFAQETGDVLIEYLDWYLQTIRISSENEINLIDSVNEIKKRWLSYENVEYKIYNPTFHKNNTLNMITRKKDNNYIVYLILRNNSTSTDFQNGIFHIDKKHWHIKKENIGLIEAMGLAILPGRLKQDFVQIAKYLEGNSETINLIHKEWIEGIDFKNIDNLKVKLEQEICLKFSYILSDCDVFKFIQNKEKQIDIIKNLIA